MRILVTGASGTVGRDVVAELSHYDCEVIPAVRDPERTSLANAVAFDFTDRKTHTSCLSGVDSLFLVRPPAISDVDRSIAPVLDNAARQGVSRIVFLSIQGVESMSWVPHAKIEERIRQTGIQSVFLRAGFFMQNLVAAHLAEIRDEDSIVLPAGRSRTAFVDTRDIAAVAAAELTAERPAASAVPSEFASAAPSGSAPAVPSESASGVPAGSVPAVSAAGSGTASPDKKASPDNERSLTLTGPQSLTYAEVADILSNALGRPIQYKSPNLVSFILRQRRRGKGWKQAAVMAMLYTITRFGNAAPVSTDIARVLGRPPRTLAEFAADHRDYWMPRAAGKTSKTA